MGATIDFIIEYDDSDGPSFEKDIDGIIDFTKSFNIVYSKPYEFMQAIAGVRGDPKVRPKIGPRGFPPNMNYLVRKHMDEKFGLDCNTAGWLTYTELLECLHHATLTLSKLEPPIQRMIGILEDLAKDYGNDRARLIFGIEGA